MVRATGEKAFLDLYEYFRFKNMPSDGQIDQWFAKIRFIPDEAVGWIVSSITNNDKLPGNLPKEFIKQWYAYRKMHPDKVASRELVFCDDCYGNGTHMFKKLNHDYNPPVKISYIAMCSKCENWQKEFSNVVRNGGRLYVEKKPTGLSVNAMLRTTRKEIEDAGWEYLPQRNPKERLLTGNANTVADGMLKEVPQIKKHYEGPR